MLLKSVEGAVKFTTTVMKQAMLSTLFSKIGALFCKRSLSKVKDKLDYNKYGGSIFVGCKKIIIKSHGSSKSITICNAIAQAIKLDENKVIEKITQKLEQMPPIGENND